MRNTNEPGFEKEGSEFELRVSGSDFIHHRFDPGTKCPTWTPSPCNSLQFHFPYFLGSINNEIKNIYLKSTAVYYKPGNNGSGHADVQANQNES